MDVLLALVVVGFVAWWVRYNQLYSSGAVKAPFFSFGSSGQSRVRRVRVAHRPAPAAAKNSRPMSQVQQREIGQAVSKITRYTHNYDVSVRLLHSTHQANMSKSLDWCAEKVIGDIIRDRR
ncbi:hypothetical protein PGN35_000460 [Nodosilinea sp. PGN35]|uniref:hypothetical protein n=1 Tax=Nodosilinea sp. PGN35 TaxID=3020489 RepID=UPI0023B228B2|nr:hypothetical protein [Nodosilinea sp. TSF1-S3]MDF0369114.1 hypothetical protein [Nodosilinea sp. TSF1-S3]MDF0369118.1 hypothetical protein [Nodosilinea sp. TSF1-S3]